jgi:N-acetylmuramoyl-L-alanine amidase
MIKSNAMIILGTAHLGTTPGKCSPDKQFREAVWSREICKELYLKLREYGYKVEIDYEPLNPSADMKGATVKQQQNNELSARVNFVNSLCKKHGASNCIYVSIHVDAAGADGKWHTAGGFSVYTSKGKTKSDTLAEHIYKKAEQNLAEYIKWMEAGKKLGYYDSKQKPFRMDTSDGDKDLESDFFVLRKTSCPAVLVECMFQDNKSDVQFLTSDSGKHAIIRTLLEGIISYISL